MSYSIKAIQARLNEIGFGPLLVDGLQGPRTDAAVTAFKASVGLWPRPYVGPLTWAALNKAPDSNIPWLAEAIKVKGLHEARDLTQLRRWFDKSVSWIDPREIPWCGAFVATCHRLASPGIAIPDNPLGARNWGTFGVPCAPTLGATLTFSRPGSSWSGHVGFYWGEDSTAFHVLGGNQSNAVTVTRVAKTRFLESRWPAGAPNPKTRVLLTTSGAPLSANEA
ncbi:TIGR02594 family protein [Loktanella atrilutea]|uniref:TIGR02594 family protein n=1 Tax=Loktanella atrilutea TaxID=366533 RepID=A0A1M4WF18_LOKAT|nr:peptidoglycan-binding protein [Loktanella atrilutea]SHE79814.1 TIGR02594 family protein [Loktanella atrilutea]